MRVDTQYVALVSHVCTATTKGNSPLEEMSIKGRCRNRSKSNAVARSWTIDSRVKGLETDHVHTFTLYIELRAVNVAPFNNS